MTLSQLKHAKVFVKPKANEPFTGTVVDVDEHGIWVRSDDLLRDLRKSFATPDFVQGSAPISVFMPFSGLEWIVGQERS